MNKRLFLLFLFFTLFTLLKGQNIYYFYFYGGIPGELKDPRLVSCFIFFNYTTQDYYVGVEWVTHTSDVIFDEIYVKNFITALNKDGYEMSYLGTKKPKGLIDTLKGNYESFIDTRSSLNNIINLKEFGAKIYDRVVIDKQRKIVKIEYVTETAKPKEVEK